MPDLVDLKRTPEDKKEYKTEITNYGDEDYAWGTQLRFDDIEAEKLGIMGLNVGDEVQIMGMARVISKSQNERQGTETNGHIEVQVTQLSVSPQKEKTSQAQRLYGDQGNGTNES